jgi:DNA-binding GntR family transcriptional regulator
MMRTAHGESVVTDLSARAAAYERLKRAIVTAQIAPGTALGEASLGDQFGVGRTPLREALQRLAGDGLVVIFPRRGMVVGQLGLHEIQELFEARLALERETAAMAARRVTPRDREELLRLNAEIHATEEHGSFGAFLDVDQRLHRKIARMARNRYLGEATERVLTLNEWLWHVHMERHGVTASDYASHDAIVESIVAGQPDAARNAMIDHIERSRGLLRVTL